MVSKKKKKRASPKLRVVFRPKSEIQRFFPPKIRWSPKKKEKKVFTEIETDFSSNFVNSDVWGGCFPMGGYFQFFTNTRPQKHKKHAILHTSQANGVLEPPRPPPPPGYATGYKYAPMQSIFHCDYFTFNHRYYDYIASPKFKNNFCNSTYEVGIYPAFLLQSTLQFCFA